MLLGDRITFLASVMAGLALLAIAAGGVSAGLIHGYSGNLPSLLVVLPITAAAFVLSLLFLLPGWAHRVRQSSRDRLTRVWLRFGAGLLLCVLTLAFLMAMVPQGGSVLGLWPRAWLPLTFAAFAPLFFMAFILPGFAYRVSDTQRAAEPVAEPVAASPAQIRPQPASQPGPQPEVAPASPTDRTWPRLKPGPVLKVLINLTIGLAAAAWLAILSVDVVPTAEGLDRLELPSRVAFLALTLPLLVLIATSPLSHGATAAKRVVLKTFLIAMMAILGGLWGMALPPRIAPFVAEVLHGSEQGTLQYRVAANGTNSSRHGNCRASVTVIIDAASDRSFEVCRIPRALVEQLEPGQMIEFSGRMTDYGLIWESVRRPAEG